MSKPTNKHTTISEGTKHEQAAAETKHREQHQPSVPRYPQCFVRLSGTDGNAFHVLGICYRAMRRAGLSKQQMDEFQAEATSGSYDHLLQTAMRWFEVS